MNYLQRCPVVLFKDLERDRKPDVLTEDEINALLDELKDPCHTMVRLAACTGLRVSELLGLKWADIRFDLQEIHPVRAIWIITLVNSRRSQQQAIPMDV